MRVQNCGVCASELHPWADGGPGYPHRCGHEPVGVVAGVGPEVLSILGYHQGGPRQVDVGMWNWKAIDVVNAHVRRRADLMESMRVGLELAAHGLLDVGALVTHRYGLDDIDLAYGALEAKPPGFLKAVVTP